jgi:hypothetical protein
MLLQACAKPKEPALEFQPWMGGVQDFAFFPQDLEVYAKSAGPGKLLVTAEESATQDLRYNRILFGPWDMSKSLTRRKQLAATFRKARGYKEGFTRWTQREWDAMAANAALKHFPARHDGAITVRPTDLRELPTHLPRFGKPTPEPSTRPFDLFQLSLLPVGTPLFISHTTKDGRWHYVECPIAGGWVDANDVALTDPAFEKAYRTGSYAAFVRDGVSLAPDGAPSVSAGIGTILPLDGTDGDGLRLRLPKKGAGGHAAIATATVGKGDAVRKPMPLTPGNVAAIGNRMMGQPYGWGGMNGNRDCSATTRDLLVPFGIYLHRNSGAQARQGVVIPLEGMTNEEKERTILREGVPFLSLVGMRGHITMYIGKYKDRAALFHNMWGLRIVNGPDDNDRLVIGRTVVSGISPGKELPNLYNGVTIADRLRTLSTPAEAIP